jgi:hypothetical protein
MRWSFHLAVTFGLFANCLVDKELPDSVAFLRHSGTLVGAGSRKFDM